MCVGTLERWYLLKPLGGEIKRHFEIIALPPPRTRRTHVAIGGRGFQRATCRQLLIRVGHHEATGIELAGRFFDILLVLRKDAVAGDIHAVDIGLRLAMDHPFGQRLANTAALQEARHHGAGRPVAAFARHGAYQRIAIGGECERAVHPSLHSHILQGRVAFKAQDQLFLDPVGVFLLQLEPVFPRRAVHHPVLVVDFIDAQQHALLILPQIGEPFQIDRHRHFEIQLFKRGDRVGNQVVVVERRDRQLDPGHTAHLLGPEPTRIDHMLARDRAFFGHNFPPLQGLVQLQHACVLDHLRPAFLGGTRIGMDGSGRVDIAFAVGPHAAQQAVTRHDRVQRASLLDADKAAVFDADGLESPIG